VTAISVLIRPKACATGCVPPLISLATPLLLDVEEREAVCNIVSDFASPRHIYMKL